MRGCMRFTDFTHGTGSADIALTSPLCRPINKGKHDVMLHEDSISVRRNNIEIT